LTKYISSAAAVAALSLMATPPALADSQVNGDGVGASFQSSGEKFRLWDNGCDGHAVYIRYRVFENNRWSSYRRMDYDGGCRTMGLFDLSLPEHMDLQWMACVNRQFLRDRCSFKENDKS
jgi:hypothetical protein